MPLSPKEVREYIVENFLFGEGNGLLDDDSFIERGIIDSTGILELITFLETRYQIKLDDADLVPENLDSINRIVSLVQRKTGDGIAS